MVTPYQASCTVKQVSMGVTQAPNIPGPNRYQRFTGNSLDDEQDKRTVARMPFVMPSITWTCSS